MGAYSRKIIKRNALWLCGLIRGDGYIDDRHVEVYNSSKSILQYTVKVLKQLKIPENKIKVDIYKENPKQHLINRWSEILGLPKTNFKLRSPTTVWKARSEKIRLRVSSKAFADYLHRIMQQPKNIHYVRGLFDAEGSVDVKGYIEFKQLNSPEGEKLVNEMYIILSKLGIESTKPKTKRNGKFKRDVYFYVKDLEKFKKIIDFTDKTKRNKLRILITAKKSYRTPNRGDVERLRSKSIWDIVSELKSPYHVIRRCK